MIVLQLKKHFSNNTFSCIFHLTSPYCHEQCMRSWKTWSAMHRQREHDAFSERIWNEETLRESRRALSMRACWESVTCTHSGGLPSFEPGKHRWLSWHTWQSELLWISAQKRPSPKCFKWSHDLCLEAQIKYVSKVMYAWMKGCKRDNITGYETN